MGQFSLHLAAIAPPTASGALYPHCPAPLAKWRIYGWWSTQCAHSVLAPNQPAKHNTANTAIHKTSPACLQWTFGLGKHFAYIAPFSLFFWALVFLLNWWAAEMSVRTQPDKAIELSHCFAFGIRK